MITFLRLTIISMGVLAFLISCSGLRFNQKDTKESTVIGYIHDLEVSSLTQINRLELRDFSGKIWIFDGSEFSHILPSHLRQHLILATPIEIRFQNTGEINKIIEIRDHIEGLPSLQHE